MYGKKIAGILILMGLLAAAIPGTLAAQADKQKIEIGEYRVIQSKILGETRRVWVHLPESYHRSGKRYPVVYKCDAMSIPLFAAKVSQLDSHGVKVRIPQVILVSIENTDRQRDMFPAPVPRRNIVPGAVHFLAFIEKELIPFIEGQYRADGYRVLMGESNSAQFCVYACLEKPRLFHGYIASSPELDWSWAFMAALAEKSLARKDFSRRHLYMIHGDKDNQRVLRSTPKFVKILETKAPAPFRWHLEVLPGQGHVPEVSMANGLMYIFEGYQAPKEVIAKGPEAIKAYYADYNKKMGHKFGVPGKALLDYAMLLLRGKKRQEALKLLEEIAATYHEGHVLISTLLASARIYRSQGKIDRVKECYKRAIKVSPPMAGFLDARISKLEKAKKETK